MKGIIVQYSEKNPKTITSINNYLFGRVARIKRNDVVVYYYYQGILHNTRYIKLSKGCYFILNPNIIIDNDEINVMVADIETDDIGITSSNYFRQLYYGKAVKNLGGN